MSFGTPEIRYNHTLNKTCLEIDVCVHTNQSNVYFDGGHIRVMYDTSVFKPNIANTGFFNATFGSDFQTDSYCFYSTYDFSANTLDITAGINYGYTLQRVLLDTVPKPFLHLAFAVNPDSASHGVAFQTVSAPYGNPTYATSSNAPFNQYYDFDTIIHLPSDIFVFLSNHIPIVLEKDAEPKIAGISDTLTIRGFHFGDAKGDVFFKAADNGGQSYLLGLDDQYHLFWSDTLIRVIVPSLVYKGYENNIESNYCSGGAGTGYVKIQTSTGDTNSNNAINFVSIDYSVLNTKMNNIIKRVYLARQHCNYDFQFTLHRSLENDSIKISVIDTAFKLWSRLTGLTIQLESDSTGALVFEDSTNVEGKNLILLDPFLTSGAMSTRGNVYYEIVTNGGVHDTILYRTTGSNIRIHPNPSGFDWNYNLSGFVGNQISFYQAFLHEIGHILLMGHVNDISNLMYYNLGDINYIILPDTSSWAVKGVLANIEASRNINWPANSGLYPIGVRKPTITIAGNKPPYICNDSAITIQANPSGEQFSWSTGATTPSISVNNAGLYSVSLTDGDCTLSDSISIGTSTLQATLTATNVHCPNDASGSISTQVTGDHPPFSYFWSGNGITPANTPQINNLLHGHYNLTLIDSVGCMTQMSENITSSVSELHICSPRFYDCPLGLNIQYPNVTCKKPVFAIAWGGSPPYQYGWYIDEQDQNSLSHVNYLSTSNYICNVNLESGQSLYLHVQDSCGQSVTLEIPPKMLQNRERSATTFWNVDLYPNPALDVLEIHTTEEDNIIQAVELYDMYGKLIQIKNANDLSIEINLSDYVSGMYLARILTGKGVMVKKFVKQ